MSATSPADTSSSQSEDIKNAVIRLAGNSQDGIQTIGGFLARLAGRSAQEVMTYMTIPSTISGGASIFQVRIGSGEVLSPGDDADFNDGLTDGFTIELWLTPMDTDSESDQVLVALEQREPASTSIVRSTPRSRVGTIRRDSKWSGAGSMCARTVSGSCRKATLSSSRVPPIPVKILRCTGDHSPT